MVGWEPVAIIGTMIPVIGMLVGLGIALYVINRNFKRRELEHRERMMAIERGVFIPPYPESRKAKPVYPFAWPFAMIGFGLALILFYFLTGSPRHDPEGLGFGLVILLIGVGLLLSRFIGVRKEKDIAEEMDYEERLSVMPGRTDTHSSIRSKESDPGETDGS